MCKSKTLIISILRNSHRNLSCLSLFATLTKNTIETKLLFIPVENDYNEYLLSKFLLSSGFGIVGISLVTEGFHFARKLTGDIKKYAPKAHIVWGGIHPTAMPEECLDYADSVCIGEGESTFLSLVKRISENEDISNLPGIGTKSLDGHITINASPPLTDNLDLLPFNKYDWSNFYIQDYQSLRSFDVNDYIQYSNYNGEDYTLMATRSCPYSCSYCCNSFLNKLYKNKGRVRKRSVDNVIQEIRYARENIATVKFINFIDDQFLTSQKWNEEFSVEYKKWVNLPFAARLAPGSFSNEDIRILKDAGLKVVQIGIQSGSERTHELIFHRKFNRNNIIEASQIFKRNDISPKYDIIIQNDFEDDSDRDKTIELLLELERPFTCNLFILTPYPKTDLESIYKKNNIKPRTDPYGKGYVDFDESDFYYQLVSVIPFISEEQCWYFIKYKNDKYVRSLLQQLYDIKRPSLGYFVWSRQA